MTICATLAGLGMGAQGVVTAHAATPIDAVLGSNNPGNPANLDITSQFGAGPVFPNKLTNGKAGPTPHVDPTYSNQWRLTEDVEIAQKYEGGAVWSNTKLDLAKPFGGKFSIFLGSAPNLGDGMTFTLQNDPRGRDAVGSGGGSLGVYGGNWFTAFPDKNVRDQDARANYIRNALSIEFDTYLNDGRNYPNESGDKPLCSWYVGCASKRYGHVAVVASAPIATEHNNVQFGTREAPLSNNTWRDFNVSWQPKGDNTGILTYQVGEFAQQSFTVNDVKKTFGVSDSDTTVNWGFTGSAVSKNIGGPGTIASTGTNAEFANPMAFAILKQPTPPTSVSPSEPEVTRAKCVPSVEGSTSRDEVARPKDTDGITYSDVSVDDKDFATITATPKDGYVLGDLGEGWTRNDDGTATWKRGLSTEVCEPALPGTPIATPEVTPATCTADGNPARSWETVVRPEDTDTITYSDVSVDDKHLATITATPKDGTELGERNEGWARNDNGTATWSRQLESKDCGGSGGSGPGDTSSTGSSPGGILPAAGSPEGLGLLSAVAALLLLVGGTAVVIARHRAKR